MGGLDSGKCGECGLLLRLQLDGALPRHGPRGHECNGSHRDPIDPPKSQTKGYQESIKKQGEERRLGRGAGANDLIVELRAKLDEAVRLKQKAMASAANKVPVEVVDKIVARAEYAERSALEDKAIGRSLVDISKSLFDRAEKAEALLEASRQNEKEADKATVRVDAALALVRVRLEQLMDHFVSSRLKSRVPVSVIEAVESCITADAENMSDEFRAEEASVGMFRRFIEDVAGGLKDPADRAVEVLAEYKHRPYEQPQDHVRGVLERLRAGFESNHYSGCDCKECADLDLVNEALRMLEPPRTHEGL